MNTGTIYSQPSETGTGRHWGTKLITLVSYLKVNTGVVLLSTNVEVY